jgi:hypothetical protein
MSKFKIHADKAEETEKRVYVACYTFAGKQEFLDDDGFPCIFPEDGEEFFDMVDAYALKFTHDGKDTFFVKRGKYGKLYNPIGMYTEGTSNKQMRHAGKPEWTFRKTSKKIFDYYIQFLKTKNLAWLHNAEREV